MDIRLPDKDIILTDMDSDVMVRVFNTLRELGIPIWDGTSLPYSKRLHLSWDTLHKQILGSNGRENRNWVWCTEQEFLDHFININKIYELWL